MNLPKFALKNKPVVMAVVALLVFNGFNVFLTAPRSEDPEYIIRDAVILTKWPGATAKQVEELVTDRVEVAMTNIKQIRRLQSTSYAGRSVVLVTTLDAVTDVEAVWDKVRAELKLIEPLLPEGCQTPMVNDKFGDTAALVLALYQEPESAQVRPYTSRELEIFAKRLRDRVIDLRPLITTPDGEAVPNTTAPSYVARMEMHGVQQEVIYVETNLGNWSRLQLSADTLGPVLAQRNVVAPAGLIDTNAERVTTRLTGNFDAAYEIDQVVVGRTRTSAMSPGRMQIEDLASNLAVGEDPFAALEKPQLVPVYLKDLGLKVIRGYEDPSPGLVRFGNVDASSEAIVLAFYLKPGQNVSELGNAVDAMLATANYTFLPKDIRVEKVSDKPEMVDKKINEVVANLRDSVIIVLAVLVFLSGVRVAIVCALAIPMIMLIAVGGMRLWDCAIEQISLAALIIALGMLVDNAIQVCDNINRLLGEGKTPDEAAVGGPSQIGFSILIATLSILAAFIPMTFCLTGGNKEYVFSLPVVISLALGGGWVFAMTMTVIMARYILKPGAAKAPIFIILGWIGKLFGRGKQVPAAEDTASGGPYISLCLTALQLKYITIAVAVGLLIGATMLPIKSSFFPMADSRQAVVDVFLPTTAPIRLTDEVMRHLENTVRALSKKTYQDGKWVDLKKDRLHNMAVYVGLGGPRFYMGLDPKSDAGNYGIIQINAVSNPVVPQYVEDLRVASMQGVGEPGSPDYLPPVAGARVIPKRLVMGTPVMSPVDIRVIGPRLASERVLRYYADRLKNALLDSGLTWDVRDSWGELGNQLDVNVLTDQANTAGVTNATLAATLNAYYSGHYLTTYREGDHQVPVKLRLPPEQRGTIDEIKNAFVEGYTGKVPLDAIARLEWQQKPVQITRYQRERAIRVLAQHQSGLEASEVIAHPRVQAEMAQIKAEMPPGYRLEIGGIDEEAAKGERQNSLSLAITGVLIFLCLIVQYNSFVKPLMVLLTIPLAAMGGLVGLWMMGLPLGFMETLGFLALFGITLSAAILMVDFTERLIKEKISRGEGLPGPDEKSCSGLSREAFRQTLAEAGNMRLMPILMTTLTTVGGLLPLMLGTGPLFKGLATVVVVGLSLGTLMTLFVLPAIIALMVELLGVNLAGDVQPGGNGEAAANG